MSVPRYLCQVWGKGGGAFCLFACVHVLWEGNQVVSECVHMVHHTHQNRADLHWLGQKKKKIQALGSLQQKFLKFQQQLSILFFLRRPTMEKPRSIQNEITLLKGISIFWFCFSTCFCRWLGLGLGLSDSNNMVLLTLVIVWKVILESKPSWEWVSCFLCWRAEWRLPVSLYPD